MKYTYYPGCSLRGTARAYEESLLAVFQALGVELEMLEDWNCCGATAYMSVDQLQAFALAARNLALAERLPGDLITPCSGCYLVLNKCQRYMREYPGIKRVVHGALTAAGLAYGDRVKVRHPLDVLAHDVGAEAIARRVVRPLTGLRVAPYYGCQIVRPYATFDDQHHPQAMDRLLAATGATVVDFSLKTRCCGGTQKGTLPEVGLHLVHTLLHEARARQAYVISVVCALCQFNLEAFQDQIARELEPIHIPVLYFTQILGLAFGLPPKQLGLQRSLVPVEPCLAERGLARATSTV